MSGYSLKITDKGTLTLPPPLAKRWKSKAVRVLPLERGFVVRETGEIALRKIEKKLAQVGKKVFYSLIQEANGYSILKSL